MPALLFEPTPLKGAWVVSANMKIDERGFFARAWCRNEFAERGLTTELAQANMSCSTHKGTIRGLHYQIAPVQEAKLVRCVRGAIWDVIIDLRGDSPTYLESFGVELTSHNRRQLYVPEDFAHGYQTLEDESEVFYLSSEFYSPAAERGIRWNDSRIAITWPIVTSVQLSPKDQEWPDFVPERVSRNDS